MPLNVAEPVVAHQELYEYVTVISPGKEDGELKAQDMASTWEDVENTVQKKQMAIVCDGLSQSPCSDEAAGYVSDRLHCLYEENGIGGIVDGLLEKRAAFINMPIQLDHVDSPVLKAMFEEIVKEKRVRSHQTTFIAACLEMNSHLTPAQTGVHILGCGDSGAFIFTAEGELLYSNLIQDASASLIHASTITEALPDSYDKSGSHILSHSQVYEKGIHILLCSDGLYDAFASFADLFSWLSENAATLRQKNEEAVMSELHSRLGDKKGDDDISFVWLFPREASVEAGVGEPNDVLMDPPALEIHAPENLSRKSALWKWIKRAFRSLNFLRGLKVAL